MLWQFLTLFEHLEYLVDEKIERNNMILDCKFQPKLEKAKYAVKQLETKLRNTNDKKRLNSPSRDIGISKKEISLPSLLPLDPEIQDKKEELKRINRENLKISYEIEDYM